MKGRGVLFIVGILTAVGCNSYATEAVMLSGVYHKGHNITEPRPRESKFITVREAGFLVARDKEREKELYYIEIVVSDKVPKPYFLQIIFENPLDAKSPFVEEAEISDPPPYIPARHGPVKGLKIYCDYSISVKVFQKKGDPKPLDSLIQPVRAYLDTTGTDTKFKGGLKHD